MTGGPFVTSTQPPAEDLRNALQIADMGRDGFLTSGADQAEALDGFRDIVRLLQHALQGLAEPNEAAITVAWGFLPRDILGDPRRHARDLAAVILKAQLSGGGGLSEGRGPQ